MKCIRYKRSRCVDRLSNGDAEFYVSTGQAVFIPKSEWRIANAERDCQ